MAKKFFLPQDDEGKATWLTNFAAKLTLAGPKFGITGPEVGDMQACAMYFRTMLDNKKQVSEFASSFTSYKNALRDGLPAGVTLQPLVMPTLSLPAMVPAPGFFYRALIIAAKIKAHETYNEADGENLGIVGIENSAERIPVKPVFTIRFIAGQPELVWKKGGMTSIEFEKMDDAGNWQFLAIDTKPNYTDTTPLPAGGKSAKWQYRAVYRRGDERVGDWSDVVSVTVAG